MSDTAAPRIAVRKTYKLYIGGAFPRSESGRSYPVTGEDGTLLAPAARASRKNRSRADSSPRYRSLMTFRVTGQRRSTSSAL